jgi:hypothetical protein
MTKAESEKAIRSLCHKWKDDRGTVIHNTVGSAAPPPTSCRGSLEHHSQYLDFRTTTTVTDDVERWFDQEFKQTWRN